MAAGGIVAAPPVDLSGFAKKPLVNRRAVDRALFSLRSPARTALYRCALLVAYSQSDRLLSFWYPVLSAQDRLGVALHHPALGGRAGRGGAYIEVSHLTVTCDLLYPLALAAGAYPLLSGRDGHFLDARVTARDGRGRALRIVFSGAALTGGDLFGWNLAAKQTGALPTGSSWQEFEGGELI